MQQQYDIGKRLREVMAERGVTISQLAELTDVSEDTIKAIRSGKTKSPGIQLMIYLDVPWMDFSIGAALRTRNCISCKNTEHSTSTASGWSC